MSKASILERFKVKRAQKKPERIKCRISVYGYGNLKQQTFVDVLRELSRDPNGRIEWEVVCPSDDALISRIRSWELSQAMATSADVWVQLDHDIGFVPGDIAGLVERAYDLQACVAGLYPFRAKGRTGFPFRPIGASAELTMGADELVKARMIPTGFLAVPLRAMREAMPSLEAHPSPDMVVRRCRNFQDRWFYDIFRPYSIKADDGLWDYLSEDWAFSMRCQAAGIACYIWTRPLLTHIGDYYYGVDDAAGLTSAKAQERLAAVGASATGSATTTAEAK